MLKKIKDKIIELAQWRQKKLFDNQWEQVVSSNVDEMKYDSENEIMTIKFLSGGTYEYENVPQWLYDEILNANSIGSQLHWNVKEFKDKYPYTKIS